MKNGFSSFLVGQDIFGQPVTVFYKGSDVYQTKMGALCTMLTYAFVIVYGVALGEAFIDNSKQSESV